MPGFDLTRGVSGRFDRRRAVLLIATPLVAGAIVLAVVTRGNGAADGGGLGPTVVAEPRDLATTLEASGSLQRSDEYTVAYAAALPSDGGSGDGDGGGASDGGDGSDDGEGGGSGDGDVNPVSYLTGPSCTSSSSTTPSSTTSTTSPCSPMGTSPTSTSSSSTTSTTPCPRTTSTTSTTTPPTSTTSTTSPPPSSTPTTRPRSGGGGTSSPPPADAGPASGSDGGAGSGAAPGGGDGVAPDGPSDGGDGGDGDEVPSAILTSLLDVGARADRGTVLYTADQEPVVALIGDLPAWRTLEQGVDDGADVRQLEENLVALGYGDDLDVDETFTADTAAAVEAWETDLGRAAPDGVVSTGDVVFLTAPGDVLGHEASVGDTLEPGSPVMTVGSEQRIVVADVDAREAGGWTAGSTVELEWADGTTTEGTVIGTGSEVSDGQVELTVAVSTGDSGSGDRRSGAEATVTLVDARREGVIAVPVAAIVDNGGSPAVRVAQADGPDIVAPVETGLVADGWIEITAGLDGGEEIRVPG
jgi:hypothetical protein